MSDLGSCVFHGLVVTNNNKFFSRMNTRYSLVHRNTSLWHPGRDGTKKRKYFYNSIDWIDSSLISEFLRMIFTSLKNLNFFFIFSYFLSSLTRISFEGTGTRYKGLSKSSKKKHFVNLHRENIVIIPVITSSSPVRPRPTHCTQDRNSLPQWDTFPS